MSSANVLHQTYYGLGSDWWKQIIDSDCHQHGALVFDEGKHGRNVEPGFLKGISDGSSYAVEALASNDLSVTIYMKIHEITCSHFKNIDGRETGTAGEPGVFRTGAVSESIPIDKWGSNPEETESLKEDSEVGYVICDCLFDPVNKLEDVPAAFNKRSRIKWDQLGPDRDRFLNLFAGIAGRVDALNRVANPHGAHFSKSTSQIYVDFEPTSRGKESVAALFSEFNNQIKSVSTQKEKLFLIADLFQKLEWKHPPQDGTTRTDLILLNVLLSKYGFNPAILENPAYATFHLLDEWISYLEKGMEIWKAEKAKI